MHSFYEFFAGGGLVRAGLGPHWRCLFANDLDQRKALTYQLNWGSAGELRVGDVADVRASDLPGHADLIWGSFPCQDLSLAGGGAGLSGERSGAFYPFWALVSSLIAERRGPKIIAVENVCGALTSRGGNDFDAICRTFSEAGYRFGALVIDAALFVPQSRPRLFVVGIRADIPLNPGLISSKPLTPFHTSAVQRAMMRLDRKAAQQMVWWNLPTPAVRNMAFADLVEVAPAGVSWQTSAETIRLLGMMSAANRTKVKAVQLTGQATVGCVYRRTRPESGGGKVQRAEVRFDDIAGCLRTPAGGSSRQMIIVVEGDSVQSRLMSARETARLMGLADDYRLPARYNDAYHLTGDGVVVPVVRHLSEHIFEPLLRSAALATAA